MRSRVVAVLALALVVGACGDRRMFVGPGSSPTLAPLLTATPPSTPLPLADLIRSGRVRVAFSQPNITCVSETGGRAAGLCVDIARELAAQMGVTLSDQTFTSSDELCEAGRRGQWDVAFVSGFDADLCPHGLSYTTPYLELEQTYLVANASPLRTAADVDAPGIRIAAFSPSPIHGFLRRSLQHATLLEAGLAQGVRLMEQGNADAYAASRADLVERASLLGGVRVLGGTITRVPWRIAIASGRGDLLTYVSDFLTTAKQGGSIQRAVEKNRVAGAVVPP